MTMGDHTAAATTQQRYPWRAARRTFAQVVVALPAFLLALSGVLLLVTQDQFAQYLPEHWVAWLGGVSVGTAAFAGLLARVMAYPAVDRALKALSSSPKA